MLAQMAQIAMCYRHHLVDQQLSRLLLMHLDRMPSNKLLMTQDLIANMLGVRRESITEAIHKLQIAEVVATSRGHITVLNRAALERVTCECYSMIRKEYDRLLSMPLRTTTPRMSIVPNRVLGVDLQLKPVRHAATRKMSSYKPKDTELAETAT